MEPQASIQAFLSGSPFAVAGASKDRRKYGNKVLRCYQQHGHRVFPLNPAGGEIEGLPAATDLASLPEIPWGLSVITPPPVTADLIPAALDLGIHNLWLQPGAEHPAAVAAAEAAAANLIWGGPCLLVVLGYEEG